MSQQIGGYPPSTASSAPTTQRARGEAEEVGRTAADAGRKVAGAAGEQAANVAEEVKAQSRDLLGEVRGQVQDQARTGQQKATDGIRMVTQELREMADGGQSGPASELARQAADRGDRLAEWLSDREPGDLVEEIRLLARRRPWAFLAGAAVAGVVAGRLTRGAVDSARADSAATSPPRHAYREPARPVADPALSPYAGPTSPGLGAPAYPASEVPTPPQGTVPVEPYAPAPAVSTPLPPAAAGPVPEPYEAPPSTYAPGPTTEDYAAEQPRVREPGDDRFTDPLRPENGGSR